MNLKEENLLKNILSYMPKLKELKELRDGSIR